MVSIVLDAESLRSLMMTPAVMFGCHAARLGRIQRKAMG
jgi:hypothetical protein